MLSPHHTHTQPNPNRRSHSFPDDRKKGADHSIQLGDVFRDFIAMEGAKLAASGSSFPNSPFSLLFVFFGGGGEWTDNYHEKHAP